MPMTTFTIPSSHPSLAGHFPGDPIVPGVVILGEILTRVSQSIETNWFLSTVPSIKFHSPLRPSETVQLTFDILTDHEVTFSCQVGSQRIASGVFRFETNEQDLPS